MHVCMCYRHFDTALQGSSFRYSAPQEKSSKICISQGDLLLWKHMALYCSSCMFGYYFYTPGCSIFRAKASVNHKKKKKFPSCQQLNKSTEIVIGIKQPIVRRQCWPHFACSKANVHSTFTRKNGACSVSENTRSVWP